MRKVFWENPYQTHLTTKIASVHGNELLFEETIAFSFCGGQENDKAFINGLPVLNSRIEGNLIYYTVPGKFEKDNVVEMVIDWPRRYRLMRHHFAAELVLEIVTQKWGLEKTGAHIAEHKARIDFRFDNHISELFEEISNEYNQIIEADLPIQTGYLDLPTQRRFWKIEGFASVPCGGTHVRSTKEVGFASLKRARAGKGIERIEIALTS